MKKEKQHIIDLIYQLDFENAAKHLFQLSKEEQISLMVCEAADTDSIIILGFLSYIYRFKILLSTIRLFQKHLFKCVG